MAIKILSATFTLLLLLCSAQPPPPDAAQQYLQPHNQARSEVGVGPLRWIPALTKSASLTVRLQRDKQNCSFADLSNSRYGGNQFWAAGSRVSPRAAVESWTAEKQFYDHANNSCEADHQCGTYTQVVWRDSAEVGCAAAACAKERRSLTVCFYDPPGNIVGEKPY